MKSWSKLVAVLLLLTMVLAACGPAAAPAPATSVPQAKKAEPKEAPKAAEPAKASSKDSDAMAKFEALVQAAKKEGKIVISNSQTFVRDPLKESFEKKYGIEIEFLQLAAPALLTRLQRERPAGQYNIDILLGGVSTFVDTLIPEGWVDPLDDALILPEVTDTSKWQDGKLPWVDPEHKVLRLNKYVSPYLSVNSTMVKKDDIKSYKDLLDPKWKGKIAAYDPTVPGAGAVAASFFMLTFGEEFVKQLYTEQVAVFSTDNRQLSDWLAHGRYPILVWGTEPALVEQMQKDGLPIEQVAPADIGSVAGGWGLVGMFNKAPHPNAAKLFVNWVSSKEGGEHWLKISGRGVTRADVDDSALPDYIKLKPGVKYMDTYDYEFQKTQRSAAEKRLKELIQR